MSNREYAKNLIDQIPDSMISNIIIYLSEAVLSNDMPNADTLEAFAELENGGGHKFSGTTEQLFAELGED